MWNYLKINFFVWLALAVISGIIFRFWPSHQEMVAIFAKSSLVAGMAPIGFVIIMRFMTKAVETVGSWPQARRWGHAFTAFGVLGIILLASLDGPDVIRTHQGTDIRLIAILAVISFGLLIIGWLVNHIPTSTEIRGDWGQFDPQNPYCPFCKEKGNVGRVGYSGREPDGCEADWYCYQCCRTFYSN